MLRSTIIKNFKLILSLLPHLVVGLWHNERWCLLLGQEGEVEDICDGHQACLGVKNLSRHSGLDEAVLNSNYKDYLTLKLNL